MKFEIEGQKKHDEEPVCMKLVIDDIGRIDLRANDKLVLWIDTEGNLHKSVNSGLEELGFDTDRHDRIKEADE